MEDSFNTQQGNYQKKKNLQGKGSTKEVPAGV